MQQSTLNVPAFLMIAAYLAATIAVGVFARAYSDTAIKYLHARGSLPTAVTTLAFLAANCGALEIVGIFATSAKYGALALHFYWIGAIPAMITLALVMIPVYLRSGAMTVPDFIRIRFNDATHILTCTIQSIMMVLVSGISLYAISTVLHLFFGWSFSVVMIPAAFVVLCYVFAGGVKAAIYNEVFQLALTVVGIVPMVIGVYRSFHGVRGIMARLPAEKTHVWSTLPLMKPRTATMDDFGVVIGLGAILSFGYWCTDFVLIQRALAARTAQGAIRTPLIAALAKLAFPWLLVFPGMASAAFMGNAVHPQFDYALPMLMQRYYGPALAGLGISAILASLMSSLAGNISAFATLCVHDLYRTHLQPEKSDVHYLWMGRSFTAIASFLGVATAYIVLHYNNLMDYLLLVFSLFNAPLFGVFLLGMFTEWATPTAGFCGLLGGVIAAALHSLAIRSGVVNYGSPLLGDFYGAIYGWSTTIGVTCLVSALTERKPTRSVRNVTFSSDHETQLRISSGTWALVVVLVLACVAMNVIFR